MRPRKHNSSNTTQSLVEALKNFILPIADRRSSERQDLNDSNRIHLVPEAQALIKALENFVTAVVHPQLVNLKDSDEALSNQASDSMPIADLKLDASSITPVSKLESSSETSALRNLIIEEARQRVFNKMPIRLLTFREDGSSIELVERNVLWERILEAIEADFYEQKIESKIQDRAERYLKTFTSTPENVIMAQAQAEVTTSFISQHTQYAILSHTWLHDSPGEVTYADWKSGELAKSSPGYQKLVSFCKIAATQYNVTCGWMDTICINKESSSELDESIHSMYKWYNGATICIAYLARTLTVPQEMRNDPWFTRGWTLQELLAPSKIQFHAANWNPLAPVFSNNEIQEEITAATTITGSELSYFRPSLENNYFTYIPISRRMQWAANRNVTREEDAAYSLMGIFDVSISIAYGEGSERAFIRLVKEIFSSSNGDVLDIINWGSGPDLVSSTNDHPSSLIPSSPKQYLRRIEKQFKWPKLIAPVILTHLGFHLPVLLMPAVDAAYAQLAPIGNYYATVEIGIETFLPRRIVHQRFNVLAKDNLYQDRHHPARLRITLGVLNFIEYGTTVEFPSSLECFAVPLRFQGDINPLSKFKRLLTEDAVVFDLKNIQQASDRDIRKTELAKHGIQLLTTYL